MNLPNTRENCDVWCVASRGQCCSVNILRWRHARRSFSTRIYARFTCSKTCILLDERGVSSAMHHIVFVNGNVNWIPISPNIISRERYHISRRSHSLLSCICGNAAALPETQLRAAGAAARSQRSQRSQSSNSKYYRQYGSPKAQWTIYWTQVTQQAQPAQPAQLVQLRAANAASASRAPIRSTIGSMGPQKPNEQYIERRWRSRRSQRSQRSWCSCAQPTQPAHPELQFEVL